MTAMLTAISIPATTLASSSGLGQALPIWSALPFVLMLASIAILPLAAPHWWEHNKNRAIVSGVLGVPFAIYLVRGYGEPAEHALAEAAIDYASFLTLLFALYVVSGGIYIRGSLAGSPLSNTTMMAIGAVIANLIGTTGASMVLIRPLLRANRTRNRKTHLVVFFIFIVSNCGGLLTPLGDPPLFLGFLKGVPFEWTLQLWKEWLLVIGALLVIFHAFDSYVLDREEQARPGAQLEEALKHERIGIDGGLNLLWLIGVVAAIVARGRGFGTGGGHWPFGVQEAVMLGLAGVAYATTRPSVRAANRFSFVPIVEVAVLFAGIFATMIAPVALLNAHGGELGIREPWQYFWATGGLSSFLDNAPTYLAFAAAAAGQAGVSLDSPRYLADFLETAPQDELILAAISCGAVFMGAMTYIGNGPNFMVKAIAEQDGVKMPSFFGYMAWSACVLVPVFVVVTFAFFA
jgi:Na+/H+ antiporter NhaD/arsenite permease-like protein